MEPPCIFRLFTGKFISWGPILVVSLFLRFDHPIDHIENLNTNLKKKPILCPKFRNSKKYERKTRQFIIDESYLTSSWSVQEGHLKMGISNYGQLCGSDYNDHGSL